LLAGAGLCLITGCSGGLPAVSQAHTGPGGNPLAGNPLSGDPLAATAPAGPPDASLAGVHACSLIPAPVVARILGPLLDKPYQSPDGLDCFYETAVPGGGGPTYILTVFTRTGFDASKAFAQGAAQAGSAKFAAEPGLGDDAFALITDTGAPGYTLSAVKAGKAVDVNVDDLGQGVRNARELVAVALGRL
jgi:hypothetical protein